MNSKAKKQFETLCVGSPELTQDVHAHQIPIYATAAFKFADLASGTEAFLNQPGKHVYSRYGNPTVEQIAQTIADLESLDLDDPAYALMTGSGMAAIHLVIQALCRPGDHILTQADLYGGTSEMFNKIFHPLQISNSLVDFSSTELIEDALNHFPNTRIIYIETPTNPMLNCVDIQLVSILARSRNVMLVVDNTFNTPYITRPLTLGADIVVHSTTKFIHGHGYSTGGVVIAKHKELVFGKFWDYLKLNGSILSPFEAMLIQMGIKTLAIRMEKQSENALELAKYLSNHPKVKSVFYPGLHSHPHYYIAQKQMYRFGAILSIDLDVNQTNLQKILKRLKIGKIAPSLGEADTMIMHPASMSHLKMSPEIRQKFGITEGLVRLSVGLESIDDQLDNWKYALE